MSGEVAGRFGGAEVYAKPAEMPEPMVREDIERGRLVILDLQDWRGGSFPLQLIYKSHAPPGPAGRWLIRKMTLEG